MVFWFPIVVAPATVAGIYTGRVAGKVTVAGKAVFFDTVTQEQRDRVAKGSDTCVLVNQVQCPESVKEHGVGCITIEVTKTTPQEDTDGQGCYYKGFQLYNMPHVMREKLNWPVAAALLERWLQQVRGR